MALIGWAQCLATTGVETSTITFDILPLLGLLDRLILVQPESFIQASIYRV